MYIHTCSSPRESSRHQTASARTQSFSCLAYPPPARSRSFAARINTYIYIYIYKDIQFYISIYIFLYICISIYKYMYICIYIFQLSCLSAAGSLSLLRRAGI